MTKPASMLDVALSYQAAGRSVVPIAPGSKIPSFFNETTGEFQELPWKKFQRRPADQDMLRVLFAPRLLGIGVVCGPASGRQIDAVQYGLEVIDVDDAEVLEQFVEAANWQGLGEVLQRLLHQRTPGGAGHFAYLCAEWAGNTILARRPGGPGEPPAVTLIETRGAGGQVVSAPTPPGIHPDHPDRGYELIRGSWEDLPPITTAARQALLALARSFNTYVDPKQVHTPRGLEKSRTTGARPGDQLNQIADRAWWCALLEQHGWTRVHTRGDVEYWQRPSKEGKAWSATLGACGPYFYVFSSNAAPFETGRAYQPFSAYAILKHGGDFNAAAKALAPPRQRHNGQHRTPTETESSDEQDETDIPMRERFRVDERGVWYTPPEDKEGNQPADVWVCAPLRIVAASRDLDNNNHGHLLEFNDRHGYAQQWAMPLELLEEQREYRKVLRRLGLVMNSAAREALQKYLDVCHAEARARCVDRVGWHGVAYVLPDTTLGDAGEERLVLQNLDHRSEGYRQSGTLESWRQTIAAACVSNSRLLLAVSTAFAAPLLALLDEESGGLHFRGASSSGKTTAVYVAATVWGEPSRLERWRATANALEGVALAHNDNLLCLDELKELDPHEAGGVAYMLANGAGKRRGQPYGGTRPRLTWRLLFLSTGETSLEQHIAEAGQRIHAGQEVRLVDVPADAGTNLGLFEHVYGLGTGQAFADQLREYTRQHYGHAGRAFVTMLAKDRDAHRTQLRELMAAFVEREVSPEATGQVARVARRFALIAAAGELATAGGLTGWPEGEAFVAAQRCFQDWLGQRGSVGNADDVRALAQVRLYFEKYGVSRFEPWRESDGETCQRCHGTGHVSYTYMEGICFTCHGTKVITPDHPAIRLIQSHAGWSKATEDGQTEFYVEQEVFQQDIARGLDVQWLCRLLKAKGYLLPDSRGKNRRRERLPGRGLCEVYRITAQLLGAQKPGEKEEEESEM